MEHGDHVMEHNFLIHKYGDLSNNCANVGAQFWPPTKHGMYGMVWYGVVWYDVVWCGGLVCAGAAVCCDDVV